MVVNNGKHPLSHWGAILLVDLLEPFRVLMTSLFYVLALHLVHYPHPTWHTSLCFTMFFLPLNPAFCSHTAWLYTPGRQVLPVDLLKLPSTQFSLSLFRSLHVSAQYFPQRFNCRPLFRDPSTWINPAKSLPPRISAGCQGCQGCRGSKADMLPIFMFIHDSSKRNNSAEIFCKRSRTNRASDTLPAKRWWESVEILNISNIHLDNPNQILCVSWYQNKAFLLLNHPKKESLAFNHPIMGFRTVLNAAKSHLSYQTQWLTSYQTWYSKAPLGGLQIPNKGPYSSTYSNHLHKPSVNKPKTFECGCLATQGTWWKVPPLSHNSWHLPVGTTSIGLLKQRFGMHLLDGYKVSRWKMICQHNTTNYCSGCNYYIITKKSLETWISMNFNRLYSNQCESS